MSERLIQTEGCYVGIFDALSPINVAGSFQRFMSEADRQAATAQQGWSTLYRFNDQWIAATARGEILTWIVLFDGVFKTTAKILVPPPRIDPTTEQVQAFLGQDYHPLVCPSGRIMVASLNDLGNHSLEPLVVVEPGTYRVALTRDDDQEDKHSFLTDPAQYPPLDGPDWSIDLWLM